MMSGIISDTLHLNSPTSTEKDAEILTWLAGVAGVNSRSLADAIFSSGSVILANLRKRSSAPTSKSMMRIRCALPCPKSRNWGSAISGNIPR